MNDVQYSDIMYQYDHRDRINSGTSCRLCTLAKCEEFIVTPPKNSNLAANTIIHDLTFSCTAEHNLSETIRYGCTYGDTGEDAPRCASCRFAIKGPIMEYEMKDVGVGNYYMVYQQLYHCRCYKKPFKKDEFAKPYYRCVNFKRKKTLINENG